MSEADQEKDHAWNVVDGINRAWLEGRTADLQRFFHPDLAMAFPGFAGTAQGAEAVIAGFEEFVGNAAVEHFETDDRSIHVAGGTAVVTFSFVMSYSRDDKRYRSTGRDLWVLSRQGTEWIAVWRTMLDLTDDEDDG